MIKLGDLAPNFVATATDGRVIELAKLRGKTVVLYFFPRAFTSGCTLETQRFRDSYPSFQRLGAEVIGISTDALERQCRFAVQHGVPFPLVGDASKQISRAYGVLHWSRVFDKRVTVIVNHEGRVKLVIEDEPARHADRAQAALKT